MPDFNKLQEHTEKLNRLLTTERQHEGLVSWSALVAEHWKDIANMWIDIDKLAVMLIDMTRLADKYESLAFNTPGGPSALVNVKLEGEDRARINEVVAFMKEMRILR